MELFSLLGHSITFSRHGTFYNFLICSSFPSADDSFNVKYIALYKQRVACATSPQLNKFLASSGHNH